MEAKDINFAAMPQTAVKVVTAPAEFFKGMPKTGGYVEPLIFVVIMGFIAGIIQAVLSLLGLHFSAGMQMSLASIIIFPIAAVIGSFIGAAIIFVIWRLMGSPENYEASYRCMAYLMALVPITAILGVIPYVGGFINMAIYVFYLVVVSTQVHNIEEKKAWIVFGVVGLIFALIGARGEYSARHMAPTVEQYRKAAEETNKQYQQQIEEARRLAEEAKKQANK